MQNWSLENINITDKLQGTDIAVAKLHLLCMHIKEGCSLNRH